MHMKVLKNKCAVITGGSDGIGFAIATKFAEQGADLYLIGKREIKLQDAIKELSVYGTKVYGIAMDLSQISEIEGLAKTIFSHFSKIDILVNNAGIGRFVPFAEMNEEILDMHLNLNVKAPYMLTKQLLGSLLKHKGNVINISSYFAHRMLPGRATTAYSLTKGAIDSFTTSLAFELGAQGIRVNAIAPGSINTAQFNHNLSKLSAEHVIDFEKMVKTIYPMGKIGEANDIAEAAVFLASDSAKWITGISLPVDGGLTTN
ncbi:SDR family NAD(P)-dependent oxidoreductase [Myroides odoratus]|uniref:SDR family NAD(P)-dependent oxidoreductase n=1 Tax=Myroides odoratus TaxID=256 RepID=UPI0039B0FEDA